jgi:hypothetical protein
MTLRHNLKDTLRASADYVLIVWWGIPLALALRAVFSLRPTESLGEHPSTIRVAAALLVAYASLAIQLSIRGLAAGALLSLGAQLGQKARMPRIALKILGAIASCVVTLILVKLFYFSLVADVVSLNIVVFLSFVLPIIFGFLFLVGPAEPKQAARIGIRQWLVLALSVLFVAQLAYAHMRLRWVMSSVHDPRFDLAFVKWQPGPDDLSEGFTATEFTRLTDHEMDLLRELGMRGRLQSWAGAGNPTSSRMRAVVVMYRPIHADVDLPKPLDGDVMYLQTPTGWRKIPDFAVTAPRSIRLSYIPPDSKHTEGATKYFVDNGFGISPTAPTIFAAVLGTWVDLRMDGFSWTPEEEKIDPSVGSVSPPAKSP